MENVSIIKHGEVFELAVNDQVEIISTTNDELDGQQGVIKRINSSEEGTEVRVALNDGRETWVDAEELISLTA